MYKKQEADELMQKIADAKIAKMKNAAEVKGGKPMKKRDNEIGYMFWIDKGLMKKLKLTAVEEDTSVKYLIEKSIRLYLKDFE